MSGLTQVLTGGLQLVDPLLSSPEVRASFNEGPANSAHYSSSPGDNTTERRSYSLQVASLSCWGNFQCGHWTDAWGAGGVHWRGRSSALWQVSGGSTLVKDTAGQHNYKIKVSGHCKKNNTKHIPIVVHSCAALNKSADYASMTEWRSFHLATLDEMVGETACTDLVALVVRTLQKFLRVGVSYVVLGEKKHNSEAKQQRRHFQCATNVQMIWWHIEL